MPAARMTLRHFSISPRMKAPNSCGELPTGSARVARDALAGVGLPEYRGDLGVELVDDRGKRVRVTFPRTENVTLTLFTIEDYRDPE